MSNEDIELYEMFHGEEKPLHPDTVHMTLGGYRKPAARTEKKASTNTASAEEAALEPADKPTTESKGSEDAKWKPVKPDPNWMDNLKACAKSALLFGGLSLLFFYWQQTGQMALTASMTCICACMILIGCSIGKYSARGNR